MTQKQVDASYHKNISYRPLEDRLKGVDQDDAAQRDRVHEIMRGYSQRAIAFMSTFLKKYAACWKIDFASFRPIEESGRQASLHSRNDLLHFDSFPTRPSHGDRLLRIFTNIHPERPRVWVTTDHFEALAGQFADRIGLHRKPGALETCKQLTVRAAARLGPAGGRPAALRPLHAQDPPRHEGRRRGSRRPAARTAGSSPPARPGSSSPTVPATPA